MEPPKHPPINTARSAARELLHTSLEGRALDMREHALRCRAAYRNPGPLRASAERLAETYERAAQLFEDELAKVSAHAEPEAGPDEPTPSSSPRAALQRLIPPELIEAYSSNVVVHAVFTKAAIHGLDREHALVELAKALVLDWEAMKQAFAEHLQKCQSRI
jgi:hypothetical protein